MTRHPVDFQKPPKTGMVRTKAVAQANIKGKGGGKGSNKTNGNDGKTTSPAKKRKKSAADEAQRDAAEDAAAENEMLAEEEGGKDEEEDEEEMEQDDDIPVPVSQTAKDRAKSSAQSREIAELRAKLAEFESKKQEVLSWPCPFNFISYLILLMAAGCTGHTACLCRKAQEEIRCAKDPGSDCARWK